MDSKNVAKTAKVYFCSADEGWSRLQRLYAPRDAKAKGQTAIRSLIYRNGLQCAISLAEYLPSHSSTYLLSLISFIEKSGSITGLEPIFLTFLNVVSANGDIKTFQQATVCWNKFSTRYVVSADAGLPVFYDVGEKTLVFFNQKTFDSLRYSGRNVDRLQFGKQMGARVSSLGLFTLSHLFQAAGAQARRPEQMGLSAAKSSAGQANRALAYKTWSDACHVIGGAWVVGGVAAEFIPGAQVIGTVAVIVGVAIEMAPSVIDFIADLQQLESKTVDVGDVEITDDEFAEDTTGNMGTVPSDEPSEDAEVGQQEEAQQGAQQDEAQAQEQQGEEQQAEEQQAQEQQGEEQQAQEQQAQEQQAEEQQAQEQQGEEQQAQEQQAQEQQGEEQQAQEQQAQEQQAQEQQAEEQQAQEQQAEEQQAEEQQAQEQQAQEQQAQEQQAEEQQEQQQQEAQEQQEQAAAANEAGPGEDEGGGGNQLKEAKEPTQKRKLPDLRPSSHVLLEQRERAAKLRKA
jgi:hypothetical protein